MKILLLTLAINNVIDCVEQSNFYILYVLSLKILYFIFFHNNEAMNQKSYLTYGFGEISKNRYYIGDIYKDIYMSFVYELFRFRTYVFVAGSHLRIVLLDCLYFDDKYW